MTIKKVLPALLAMLILTTGIPAGPALADDWFADAQGYYTVYDTQGAILFMHAGEVTVDDSYISEDNKRYRIVEVDTISRKGVAAFVEQLVAEPGYTAAQTAASNLRVAIYCTHTDESYIPTDGVESEENGGILDVAQSLGAALEEQGIQTVVDDTNHMPHDAGAYRRSRQTAVELMKETAPVMLIDVHRDGVPPEEYAREVEGEPVSGVRMVVGRSNQNSQANESFAWTIKTVADELYPGLIKDIYIGKGSYNQDLMPQAVLFEMGTHTIDKELAIASTPYLAEVIAKVLGAATSQATPAPDGGETPRATGGTSTAAPRGSASPAVTSTPPSGSQTGTDTGGEGGGGAWGSIALILGVLAVLGVGYFLFFARDGGGTAGGFFRELTGTGHHRDDGGHT